MAGELAQSMKAGIARPAALLVLIAAGLFLCFELGRYQAGYSRLDAGRALQSYADQLEDRNRAIDELERRIAILQTSGEIDRETYSSVEANLGELQARIQAQEEELVFYRGIVSPGDGVAGLRVQNVEIVPGEGEATHTLRVLLVQAIVHNDRITGSVRVNLSGMRDGEAAVFALDDVGIESRATDIPYGFRYFQTLEMGLKLPEGFEPVSLEVQVWPRSPRGETIVQSFPWPVAAA
jgi:hypothetical protein